MHSALKWHQCMPKEKLTKIACIALRAKQICFCFYLRSSKVGCCHSNYGNIKEIGPETCRYSYSIGLVLPSKEDCSEDSTIGGGNSFG